MEKTAGSGTATLSVPMVDPEIVRQLRALWALGWGAKRIARDAARVGLFEQEGSTHAHTLT